MAVGCSQKQDIDYSDTFAPVVRWETVRLLLSLSLQANWPVEQLDVTTAFLYGDVDREIYMRQPTGFRSPDHPNWVCKLKKSIYGLKQSPRIWNERLSSVLEDIGCHRCKLDPCIYFCSSRDALVACFVDDILVAGERVQRDKITEHLQSSFKIKRLGLVKNYLGVNISSTEEGFQLSQTTYIDTLLDRFGMTSCHPSPTPYSSGQVSEEHLKPLEDRSLYLQIVGALIYLASITRPDIAWVVHLLSRKLSSPSVYHFQMAKRVLRYLKGSRLWSLKFTRNPDPSLSAYVDADYGGDLDTRRSTTGYLVYHGCNLISWCSKLQEIVTQSTMEAEYVALSSVTKEIIWIRNLLDELGFPQTTPCRVKEDNQPCIKFSNDQGRFHRRSKHIDIRYHAAKEAVENGQIVLEYCDTTNMLADLLTKSLPSPRFLSLASSLSAPKSGE